MHMLRTEAQRKKHCTECPVARTANLLGDTCSLLIIRDLLEGPKRFKELEKSLEGVSTRTLTLKLQFLEKEGFICHVQSKTKPPHMEYALTTKGKALRSIISSLRSYGEKYL